MIAATEVIDLKFELTLKLYVPHFEQLLQIYSVTHQVKVKVTQ